MSVALRQNSRASGDFSVPAGLLWYLLRGNRHRLRFAVIYWALLTVLAHTTLAGVLATYDSLALSSIAIILLIPLGGMWLFSIGQFNMTTDFDGAFKGYPTYLLRLPATSTALAVWPMIFGTPSVCICWIILNKTVLAPLGIQASIAMPCLGMCAALILSQAVSWAPLNPSPRLFLYFGAVGALGGSAFGIGVHAWNPAPLMVAYLASIAIGIPLAIACVSYSRRGDLYAADFLRPLFKRLAFLIGRRRPIDAIDGRSAQAWFDTQIEGVPMPTALAFCVLPTLPWLFGSIQYPLVGPAESSWPIAGIKVIPWVQIVLFAPLVAILLGGLLGHNPLPSTAAFLRPLTSIEIARSKMRAGLNGVWSTLGVIVIISCVALLTPAADGNVHGVLGALILKDLGPSNILPIVLTATLGVLVLIRARIDGIWSSLIRSNWLSGAQLVGPAFTLVALSTWNSFGGMVGYFLVVHQTELATAAAVLKVAAFGVVISMLRRGGLISVSTILRQVGFWFLTSTALAVLSIEVLPSTTVLPAAIIGIAITAVPMVRVSLIPWAVDRARHQ